MVMPDKYQSFAELSAHEEKGKTYTITVNDQKSHITIMAIHGGAVEPGTSEITRAIAGNNYNAYTLDGDNWDIHITSTRFDEPQALSLAQKSRACITIHGLAGSGRYVCVGGMNDKLKALIIQHLPPDLAPMASDELQKRFDARTPSNIVNKCADGGVQIEISRGLRDRLMNNAEDMARFTGAIRTAIAEYMALEAGHKPQNSGKAFRP